MSHSILVQDWLSLSAPAAGATIIQNEAGWLDVSGFADACFYCEIPQITPAVATNTLFLQTSCSKDQAFFDGVATGAAPGYLAKFDLNISGASLGVQPLKIARWADASPVQTMGRFLRWKIVLVNSGGSAYTMSFRIWATLNPAGYP